MKNPLLWTVLAALSLAACGGGGGDDGDDTPPTCLPDCLGDRGYDATAYALHGTFDWAAEKLIASEDISLIAPMPVVELDAELTVSAVHAGDQQLAFAVNANAKTLRVDLTPLAPGADPVTFTVDYEAEASDSLRVGGGRDDDPVTSRVVFTDSEPDRGLRWLVAKHDPSDRALWSVELTVPTDQDVIANGARTRDDQTADGRVVGYALDKPLPTYLMAFAAGDLVHADRTTGRVPLGVWYRRGLAIEPDKTLDVVADAMATFDSLLGPYPWDSYSVVLVPQYGGGMENATVTFNLESSGMSNASFGLNAHELGHHWFGDWVTMHGYDDVWVKEGMATLLASEAERGRRDRGGDGRLFGLDFSYYPSEAIVDPDLIGLDKYTSGPYGRAAWMITQIRDTVGEAAFWQSLRGVLAAHALDSIDGETFLRSFSLDEPTVQKLLLALPQHDAPTIGVTSVAAGGDTSLTFSLTDPANVMIRGMDITVVDAAGTATTRQMAPGTPLTVTVPAGGYLATDEHEVHPDWTASFNMSQTDYGNLLAPLFEPTADPALVALEDRSAAHQETALAWAGLPSTVPADITTLYSHLDSIDAQRSAEGAACSLLSTLTGAQAAALAAAIAPILDAPAIQSFGFSYADCGTVFPNQQFGAELVQLAATEPLASLGRLEYLLGYDYGAAGFAPISQVATTAPTLRLRDLALEHLAYEAAGFVYSPVPPAQVDMWKAFFRARLPLTTSANRLDILWLAETWLGDVEALPIVAPLLHSVPLTADAQVQIICQAYTLVQDDPAAWAAFKQAVQPWDTLSPEAAAALADQTVCGNLRVSVPGRVASKSAAEARALEH